MLKSLCSTHCGFLTTASYQLPTFSRTQGALKISNGMQTGPKVPSDAGLHPPPPKQVMEAALEQHDHLLRSLLAQHGGHEVTTEGDSFTVVFHKALDAVAWCLEVQEVRPLPAVLVGFSESLLSDISCMPARMMFGVWSIQ